MTLPYLQCQDLYFIPVLRNRLAFAVLVRRALHKLQSEAPWGQEDLIAVALPPSVKAHLRKAIKLLPKVSLISASVLEEGVKEVFPVTPCDSMIEAVRTADEHGWPIEFIDLEVSPGNLLRGPCVKDPNWPDDLLVNVLGIERYLDMIEGYFSQPPARLEPLDTWREGVIAQNLRELKPLWRRILVVCDAALVRAIIARLRQPSPSIKVELGYDTQRCRYQILQHLQLDVLLGYLDDYPQLVERYNKRRAEGGVHNFDKDAELLGLIPECASEARDLRFSTRQHKAFVTFLRNLLRFGRRVCPQPDVLYGAASSCFSRAFAERLHCFLAGYVDQIQVERVHRNDSANTTWFRYQLRLDAALSSYVSRSCNPFEPPYFAVPLRPPLPPRSSDTNPPSYRWLPEEEFLLRMHRKLRRVVATRRRLRKTVEFRGGIEMGIDVRRTIRNSFRNIPKLYVKAYSSRQMPVSTENEPVVWVLSEDVSQRAAFIADDIGRKTGSRISYSKDFFIGNMDVLEHVPESDPLSDNRRYRILKYNKDQSGRLLYGRRCGWITFTYDVEDLESARQVYASEFTARIPNHAEFEHPCGCVHPDFVDVADKGQRWLDVALLTALKYAKRAIVIVASPGLIIPPTVIQHPCAIGKSFVFISLRQFSRSEREKLGAHYKYVSKGHRDQKAVGDFEKLMSEVW